MSNIKEELRDLKQEFRDLLKASGWTQAEASRQLGITPGALSQIVRDNSPVRPSQVTLKLFELLLRRDKPEVMRRMAAEEASAREDKWERELLTALRRVPPVPRERLLQAIWAMISLTLAKSVKTVKR